MTFLEQQQSDLDAIYTTDEFAEEITLGGVTVIGLVGELDPTTEQFPSVRGVSLMVSVRVSEAPVVKRGDAVAVRGSTYRVLGDPQNDRLEWNLDLAQEMVSL